jgi:hypothetical protein
MEIFYYKLKLKLRLKDVYCSLIHQNWCAASYYFKLLRWYVYLFLLHVLVLKPLFSVGY